MTTTGKILVILSDASTFAVQKKDGSISQEETGVFLQELTKPLSQLLDAGYSVTVRAILLFTSRTPHLLVGQFASPQGKGSNIDPHSQSTLGAYFGNWFSKNRDNKLVEKMRTENNFGNPRLFSSFSDEELATFSGVFIPGGHAPLTDLGDNPDLGRILLDFHNNQKPTGAHVLSRQSYAQVLIESYI